MSEIWYLHERIPKVWIKNFMKFLGHNTNRASKRLGVPVYVMGVARSKQQGFDVYFSPKTVGKLFMTRGKIAVDAGMRGLHEDQKNIHVVAHISTIVVDVGKHKTDMGLIAVNLELMYAFAHKYTKHTFYGFVLETLLHEMGHEAFGNNELAADMWAFDNINLFPGYEKVIKKFLNEHSTKSNKGILGYSKNKIFVPTARHYIKQQVELSTRVNDSKQFLKMLEDKR